MSRKSVFMCVLSLLMVAYCCCALVVSARMSHRAVLKSVRVDLSDPKSRFVNVLDVLHEAQLDPDTVGGILRDNFDLFALEQRLKASDKLQSANAMILSDGTLVIEATPMVPVARVFEQGKPSYYINASGKRIAAELRYHIDVPVLVGTFDSVHPASRLLPLLDYIASNPKVSALVATVTQEPDGNIILVPNIVGHVVNFGDTSMVQDKFRRLRAFYRHVAPYEGWTAYDTVAVKWRDQVVASKRNHVVPAAALPTEEEKTGEWDIDSDSTFMTDLTPHQIRNNQ